MNRFDMLTPEERQSVYDALAKLASMGQDEMVDVIKRLLGAVDQANRQIDKLSEDVRHRDDLYRQRLPNATPVNPNTYPWSIPQNTPTCPMFHGDIPPFGQTWTLTTTPDTSCAQQAVANTFNESSNP